MKRSTKSCIDLQPKNITTDKNTNTTVATIDTTTEAPLKEKLWSGTFLLVIFLTFASFMVCQGLNTGTSVYLAYIGETAALAGIGAAIFSISGGLARLFGGKTIDQKGRAKCIVVSMGFLAIFTVAPLIDYTGVLFVFFRMMQGISFGVATTATATAAADVLPFSRLSEGIGYSGLGQALATSIGPALSLVLVASEPHTNLFLGLFFCAVLGFITSFFLRYEKKPWIIPEQSTYRLRWEEMKHANTASAAVIVNDSSKVSKLSNNKQPKNNGSITSKLDKKDTLKGWRKYIEPDAFPGAIPLLFFTPCIGFMIYFGGLFGQALDIGNVGMFFTISAITMILIRVCSKAFMNTVAPIIIMGVAVIGSLTAYSILVAITLGTFGDMSKIAFFVAGIPHGVACGLAAPINQAVSVSNSSSERWGAANATFLLAFDAGIGLSCILWGILSDIFGFTFVLFCIMGFVVSSFILAFFMYPKHKRPEAKDV